MNPTSFETLLNLLMLSALLGALTLWWATKRGGKRGRIAERARQAGLSLRLDSSLSDVDDDDSRLRTRLLRRLAMLGDRLPLFDAKYREKLKREMVRGGYRGKLAVSVLLAVKFLAGIVCAMLAVMLGSHIPVVGRYPAARGIVMLFVFVIGMIIPEYVLAFRGMSGSRRVRIQFVDRNHGSSLTAWEAMGRPDFPSVEQQSSLRRAAELPAAEVGAVAV